MRLKSRVPQRPARPRRFVTFPTTPGVYVMKDAQGGLSTSARPRTSRSRAGSYFQKTAETDKRICDWIGEVVDIDYLVADSEVDALLLEARLIKDHSAEAQSGSQGRQVLPLPPDHHRRRFPTSQLHPRAPRPQRQALRPVSQGQEPARGDPGPPADLQVPDLLAGHRGRRPPLALVSALPAPSRSSNARAPCNLRIDQEAYRTDIRRLRLFLDGKKDVVLQEMEDEMREASKALLFEKAARLRDEIKALRDLEPAGDLAKHAQPEVFYVDPGRA